MSKKIFWITPWTAFLSKGYKATSMKEIASLSGIAVGNIYNYFKDKEALYDTIALPVFDKINLLFKDPPKNPLGGVDEKIKAFVDIYKSNRKVFVMLLDNSSNTKFENLKSTIIENFSNAIERFRLITTNKETMPETQIFIKAFACAFVNGILSILTQQCDEPVKLQVLLKFSSVMKNNLIKSLIDDNEVPYT